MKAVIFDMDGVIIDSEHLWQQAERETFTSLGVVINDENAALTKTMTTVEVTKFWYNKYPWKNKRLHEVEQMVISRVIELIENEGKECEGIDLFIKKLRSKGFKIGLATNSPYRIIPAVLNKVGVAQYFDTLSSAEFEANGKPHPAVYLSTSKKLNIHPGDCIVIEDSYSGMLAAKTAGMTVVAFTNNDQTIDLSLADYTINSFQNQDIDIFN